MLKEYKAYIFDMDGTVLNTLNDLGDAINYAFKQHGYPGDFTYDQVKYFFGSGANVAVCRALALAHGASCEELLQIGTEEDHLTETLDPEEIRRIIETFRPYYAEHCNIKTGPYPGIPELLKRLKKAGKLSAVVSNKPDGAVQDLANELYPGLFQYAVGEKEGVRRKPAPDTVYAAMEELNVNREESVYIGDSEIDLETARNAGLDVIAVTWGFRTEEFLRAHGADIIVDNAESIFPDDR